MIKLWLPLHSHSVIRSYFEGVLFNQRWNVKYDNLKIITLAQLLHLHLKLFLPPIFSQYLDNVTAENCSGAAVCWESEGLNWTQVNASWTENLEKCKRASTSEYPQLGRKKKYIYKSFRITWSTEAQWNMRQNNLLSPDPLMSGQWLPLSGYSDSAHTPPLTRLPAQ